MPDPTVPVEQLVQELILNPSGRAAGDPLPNSASVLDERPQASSQSTSIIEECPQPPLFTVVPVGTRGLLVDRSGFSKRPGQTPTYDTSDSESDPEDDSRAFQPQGRKTEAAYHQVILNKTKEEGRRREDGQWVTKRDADEKRVKKRVDNRIYGPDSWPALEADAKAIHDLIPEYRDDKSGKRRANESYGATTIVASVIMRKGEFRKIIATNTDLLPPNLRAEAERRGYHVIKAPKAHAEAELLQYMHTYGYTDMVDMGCDKEHCAECDALLKKKFGTYSSQTKASNKRFKNYHMPKPLQGATSITERPLPEPEKKRRRKGSPEA